MPLCGLAVHYPYWICIGPSLGQLNHNLSWVAQFVAAAAVILDRVLNHSHIKNIRGSNFRIREIGG